MAGVALAILVLVALLTLLAWLSYGSAARRQQTLTQARLHAAQARQSSNPDEARDHWEAVLATLAAVGEDPEAAELQAQAREALDQLNRVVRVTPTLLRDFGSDFSARRLVARGSNLFVLDEGGQGVVQLALDETGGRLADEGRPAILKAGDRREEQQVTALVDMAWNVPEGEWTTDALVILDENRRLWVYNPAWPDDIHLLFLGPAPGEGTVVAMAAFEGRLYLLAPSANQVWRYWSRDGGYPGQAEPYFSTGAPQSLAGARDLAIDGNIYVLSGDGEVAKYFDGEAVPFQVAGVPDPSPHFTALVVDPERKDGPVYLADGADGRVVILDSGGGFLAQLRASSGLFRGVHALALDDTGARLFFLAGGGLYVVSLPPLP